MPIAVSLIGIAVLALIVIPSFVSSDKKVERVRKGIDYARITTSEPNGYQTFEVHMKNGSVEIIRAHRTSQMASAIIPHLK